MGDNGYAEFLLTPPLTYNPSISELWGTIVSALFGGYLSSLGIKDQGVHICITFAATMAALPLSNWLRRIYSITFFIAYQCTFSLLFSFIVTGMLGRPPGSIPRESLFVASILDACFISAFQYARYMGLQAQKIISSYAIEQSGSALTGSAVYSVVQKPVEEVKL